MQANQQSQSEARALEERAVVSGMLDLSTLEEHFILGARSRAIASETRPMLGSASNCFAMLPREKIRRPERRGNDALEKSCVAGCIVILDQKKPAVLASKSATSHRPARASGRPLTTGSCKQALRCPAFSDICKTVCIFLLGVSLLKVPFSRTDAPASQHKPSEEHHIHARFVHSGTSISLRRADAACRSQASATCSSGTISLSTVQRPATACARIWVRAWAFCSWVSALLV